MQRLATICVGNPEDVPKVRSRLIELGLWLNELGGSSMSAFEVSGVSGRINVQDIREIPGISEVLTQRDITPLLSKLSGKPVRLMESCTLGSDLPPVLFAGPCSVESEGMLDEIGAAVATAGGKFLRGGAYKPRTSPYSFHGVGEKGLHWLRAVAEKYKLGVVTEVLSEDDVAVVGAYADLIQVGSRNMQNFALLKKVGALGKSVLLKRGMASNLEEWKLGAEHLLFDGAKDVVFCERGIRGFTETTRNLLDLQAVADLSLAQGFPVMVDPSHASGRRDLILPMTMASLASGAHAIMVEVHPCPAKAKSDGPQALGLSELVELGAAMGCLSS
ncbi:MAG: 3-deoxy-7-phosphoheptulonate synthase [Myxococcota bacterium]|nr:3-deoxy-7-phosphoheptulonate synthase [Myxococcota bacterium]